MPIFVPSLDMPKLTLPLRLHAPHCLIQLLFIRLLLCTALAAARGREEKVTEKLADTFEKTFYCHIITFESYTQNSHRVFNAFFISQALQEYHLFHAPQTPPHTQR